MLEMDGFLLDFEKFQNSWWPYVISFFVTLISAIRYYFGGSECLSDNRIDGRTIIITGSSSGIGFETAKELSKRGGNIILAVRNAEKGQRALTKIRHLQPDAKIVIKLIDLSQYSSIYNFVNEIQNEYTEIDVLINNAGTIFSSYKNVLNANEITMTTNYFGPFLLTHLLLPLLHKSKHIGRVINISALAHYMGKLKLDDLTGTSISSNEIYAQSKLALTMMTKYMAQKYQHFTNVTFNAASPGIVRNTGHWKNSTLQSSFTVRVSVWPWMWLIMKTPKQGCQTVVYLAVESSLSTVSGAYFSDCEKKEPAEALKDGKLMEELYGKTCEIVKLDIQNVIDSLKNK